MLPSFLKGTFESLSCSGRPVLAGGAGVSVPGVAVSNPPPDRGHPGLSRDAQHRGQVTGDDARPPPPIVMARRGLRPLARRHRTLFPGKPAIKRVIFLIN